MKKIVLFTLSACMTFLIACNSLDLNPLSTGSNANWYADESEVNMSLNDLYRDPFWPVDLETWTDNWMARNALTPITDATINSQWATSETYYQNAYKAIGRVNTLLANIEKASGNISQSNLDRYGNNRYRGGGTSNIGSGRKRHSRSRSRSPRDRVRDERNIKLS